MKLGKRTYAPDKRAFLTYVADIAGNDEANGNLRHYIDFSTDCGEWGCPSHEKAETKFRDDVTMRLIERAGLDAEDIDCLLGGDLLNQIVPSSFSARSFAIPFSGLYCACATFGQSLAIASMMIGAGMSKVICCTSSHFATAERQYRYPLELGTQPTPASQRTVTGAGAVLVSDSYPGWRCPEITCYTLGEIIDLGCTDANNMGAAMAPAAYDTIAAHLRETGRSADYYDLIVTGDLGRLGRELLVELLSHDKVCDGSNVNDCGCLIYGEKQKCGLGGSGAGCSSLVYCSYFHKLLTAGQLNRILLVPTGAMLSKDSSLQGESIPGIAHAVAIECR